MDHGHEVRGCGQVLRGVSKWSLVPLFPLSEHMGPRWGRGACGHEVRGCGQVLRGVSEWSLVPLFPLSEHMGAFPCHNTMVHCGTCKDVRGVLLMHTYE